MRAPLYPFKDTLFEALAKRLELCNAERSKSYCEDCPLFEHCLYHWDRLCGKASKDLLTERDCLAMLKQLGV